MQMLTAMLVKHGKGMMNNPCLKIKPRELKTIDKRLNELATSLKWEEFNELMQLRRSVYVKRKKV